MSSHFTRLSTPFLMPATDIDRQGARRFVFDTESDGLAHSATVVWCIVIKDIDGGEIFAYEPHQIADGLAKLATADYLVGHNAQGHDLPLLKRLYGWAPAAGVFVMDTLIVGRLILPDIGNIDTNVKATSGTALGDLHSRHSLEAWGARLGIRKVGADIDDWSRWTPEMQERCIGDVEINAALWRFLQPDGYSRRAIELEHRAAEVCEQITAAGIPFDTIAAARLDEKWRKLLAKRAKPLRKQFPGTNLRSRPQLIKLLVARGWIPEQRTKKGNPKLTDEMLETLGGGHPEFAGLAGYLVLERRRAQLTTGDEAWRKKVTDAGRIHGAVIHIGTPHSRAAHFNPNIAQVPNPKKGKLFAAECRTLFRPDNGMVIIACDQGGLQDRAFAHYLSEYDAGAYARSFLAGDDTHWKSTIALGLIAAGTERNKTNKLHTTCREGAKGFRYGFLFGCGGEKAGLIIYNTARMVDRIDNGSKLQQQFFGQTTPNQDALKRVGYKARENFYGGHTWAARIASLPRSACAGAWLATRSRRPARSGACAIYRAQLHRHQRGSCHL
jgi:hypothetical protein